MYSFKMIFEKIYDMTWEKSWHRTINLSLTSMVKNFNDQPKIYYSQFSN